MDGYMDTMDALHSYGSRERKKAGNLKGFSYWCICRDYDCSYVLIAAGAYSEIKNYSVMASFCGSYFCHVFSVQLQLSLFPCAKKEGTLYMFADAAQEKIVKRSLYAELALCALWQILMDPKAGIMQLYVL